VQHSYNVPTVVLLHSAVGSIKPTTWAGSPRGRSEVISRLGAPNLILTGSWAQHSYNFSFLIHRVTHRTSCDALPCGSEWAFWYWDVGLLRPILASRL